MSIEAAMSALGSDRLLASTEIRDSKSRKTHVCEFVCVAVTHFDLDPIIFDCFLYPSLKVSISHFDEMIASKCATRANFISRENAKDLASDFFIRWHLGHLLSKLAYIIIKRGGTSLTERCTTSDFTGPQFSQLYP